MIPLYDDNPRSTVPIVTLALIGVNVVVFLLQQLSPIGSYAFMMVPSVLTGAGPGQIISDNVRYMLPPPGLHPVWLTIFSSMFMHGSLMHIGGNMLYLWVFGDNIEDDLGHAKYLVFYLAVGFLAALAHVLSGPNSSIPTLGASGAVAGVMGGYILLHPRTDVHCLVPFGALSTLMRVPAWIVLGLWFVYQVLLNALGQQGAGGGVAYAAHIGGFVAGLILIKLFGPKRERARESYWR